MADLPSITVVTPALNAAKTIEQTLASVRDQGYPRVEHVVVDGGSTDGTVEILAAAPGVRYVSEPDNGLSDAMNKGVAMAEGEFIGWLNADDFYLPGALNAVGEALAANPDARWATGRCRIVDEDGEEIRTLVTAYKNFFLRRYSFGLYLTQNFVSTPATFVRKDALPPKPYDERFQTSMDYDTHLYIARDHDPVVLDRELAVFRMMEGTASMSGFERQFQEHAENARTHGEGHRLAVTVNQVASRTIVLIYRLLRSLRGLRSTR